jgi:hypothetical protein
MFRKIAAVIISAAIITGCTSSINVSETAAVTMSQSVSETAVPAVSAKVKIENGKFTVAGNEIWFNGVNTPWDNWNDFGGDFDEAFWDEHFSALHDLGCNSSRVWINCNGVSTIRLDVDGIVKSVNEKHWLDLDKLFEIAKRYEIYLMPTLLSFDHFKDTNAGFDSWRTLVSDAAATDIFIEKYVLPFVERYKDEEYLFAIDLCNEPDWVYENAESGQIPMETLAVFFAKVSAAVHENSDILTTVGLAMTKYSSDHFEGNYYSDEKMIEYAGEKAPLDFWSNHWYYWEKAWFGYPYTTTPEDFHLAPGKPALIGECSAKGDADMALKEQYKAAYEHGWSGMFAWTSNGVDDNGGLAECAPALEGMKELLPEKVFPLSGQS